MATKQVIRVSEDEAAGEFRSLLAQVDIARLGGRIEGQEEKGIQLAFDDLLIGATALHLDGVATENVRDFQRIPDLRVVKF